jgi:hypothetical protein
MSICICMLKYVYICIYISIWGGGRYRGWEDGGMYALCIYAYVCSNMYVCMYIYINMGGGRYRGWENGGANYKDTDGNYNNNDDGNDNDKGDDYHFHKYIYISTYF